MNGGCWFLNESHGSRYFLDWLPRVAAGTGVLTPPPRLTIFLASP
jgi:hypothetical protein